jgi:CheY-like chemotaxis protein
MSTLISKKALVVEDEAMVAMLIEDMLVELGCEVVAVAGKLAPALEKAETLQIDFAVLDINLGGHMTYPVADVLIARGVPFVFATGYGGIGLAEGYGEMLTVQKPFARHALQAALEGLFESAAAARTG